MAMLHISIVAGLTGRDVGTITVEGSMTGRQLVEEVSALVHGAPYFFSLVKDTAMVKADVSLEEQGFVEATVIQYIFREEPPRHDGVMHCDLCSFERFCHYGYAFCHGNGIKQPVIGVCELCGGSPEYDDEDSDDEMTECRALDSPRLG